MKWKSCRLFQRERVFLILPPPFFFSSDVFAGPASIEPDRERLCRMQMALSAPTLRKLRAYLPVSAPLLLHNYLISFLLKQHLELEHCLRRGAVPFTPESPFPLNASFVLLIIAIQRECHTLLNERATVAVMCAAAGNGCTSL